MRLRSGAVEERATRARLVASRCPYISRKASSGIPRKFSIRCWCYEQIFFAPTDVARRIVDADARQHSHGTTDAHTEQRTALNGRVRADYLHCRSRKRPRARAPKNVDYRIIPVGGMAY